MDHCGSLFCHKNTMQAKESRIETGGHQLLNNMCKGLGREFGEGNQKKVFQEEWYCIPSTAWLFTVRDTSSPVVPSFVHCSVRFSRHPRIKQTIKTTPKMAAIITIDPNSKDPKGPSFRSLVGGMRVVDSVEEPFIISSLTPPFGWLGGSASICRDFGLWLPCTPPGFWG